MIPLYPDEKFSFVVEFQVEKFGFNTYPAGCTVVKSYEGDVPGSGGWPYIEVVSGEMMLGDWATFWKSWFGARMDMPQKRDLEHFKETAFESLRVLEINGQKVGEPTPPYDSRDGIP
jgi:hypothetical protein